jgi:hypothetical protein
LCIESLVATYTHCRILPTCKNGYQTYHCIDYEVFNAYNVLVRKIRHSFILFNNTCRDSILPTLIKERQDQSYSIINTLCHKISNLFEHFTHIIKIYKWKIKNSLFTKVTLYHSLFNTFNFAFIVTVNKKQLIPRASWGTCNKWFK